MSEEKVLELLSDFADGLEALTVKLKRDIGELMNRKTELQRQSDLPADTEEILWTAQTGTHGAYDKSEDRTNPRFKALLTTLQAHQGKMTADNYFLWIFPDGQTIGRKLKT